MDLKKRTVLELKKKAPSTVKSHTWPGKDSIQIAENVYNCQQRSGNQTYQEKNNVTVIKL